MKEQEYIDCQDLGKLDAVCSILETITSKNSSVINPFVFDNLRASFFQWRDLLRNRCKIKE